MKVGANKQVSFDETLALFVQKSDTALSAENACTASERWAIEIRCGEMKSTDLTDRLVFVDADK